MLPAIHAKAPISPYVVLVANSGVLHKAEMNCYKHRTCIIFAAQLMFNQKINNKLEHYLLI